MEDKNRDKLGDSVSYDVESHIRHSYDTPSDGELQGDPPVSEHQLNRIYRKIDFRIIPALWVLYFLSSYGNAAYGNALTMNQTEHHSLHQYLKLTNNGVSVATSLDYVGSIIFDLPMNLIMSRVSPHAWISRIIITIGLVYTCFVAAKNDRGIIALRFFTGVVGAGVWPGMAYYISMWYPDSRAVTRVGYYFTAAQISAAAAGLLAAAFQKMDGMRGYTGYQWMFLIYGCVTMFVGIVLLWWLPDRPRGLIETINNAKEQRRLEQRGDVEQDKSSGTPVIEEEVRHSFFDRVKIALGMGTSPLNSEEERIHATDMTYDSAGILWDWKALVKVILDPRIWPLVMMYFGVVGVGFGIEVYATTIIENINPSLSSIDLSLLSAPIWLFDLGGILLITPLADRFKLHRALIFSFSTAIIIAGLFITTYAHGWSRWGGLLICGFGLGSTVPITMAWGAAIFRERHGDLGAASATALISGLGNLGAVTSTYALYYGWPEDVKRGYRDSNMVMVAILGISIIAALCCTLLRYFLGDFGDKTLKEVTFLRYIF